MGFNRKEKITFSEQEYQQAHAAYEEYKVSGDSKRKCLRCGSTFQFTGDNGGLEIRCKTEGCFIERIRGI